MFSQGPFSTDPFSASPAAGAYTLNAESGSFSLTGSSATLLRSRILQSDAGSLSATGAAATFLRTRIMELGAGSLAITGADATMTYTSNSSSGGDNGILVANSFPLPWKRDKKWIAAMLVGAGVIR